MRFRWRRRSRRLLKLHRNERSPDPIIEVVHGPKPDFGSRNHTVREHTSPSGERCLSSSVAVSRHGGQLPTEIRRNNFGAVENVPAQSGGWEGRMNGKFVAYYRVSTDEQGKSGLGFEAQRQAVENYLNAAIGS
jgi:hypothetical protein